MMFQLFNHNCRIVYDDDKKEIDGYDLTDKYNDPKFFSTKIRGLKKGWNQLEKEFNQFTTMYGAIYVLDRFNCQCHSYCAVD